ncbi:MAG: hypothetical protein LBC35_05885 [Coriobacteriales bacterium]|jgi:uncharacterized protein (DUF697 family)|nr:hypothetical protein [Coriobacteriales bacterium]
MKIPSLPISLKALTKAGKGFIGLSEQATSVAVLVDETADKQMVAACRRFLTPAQDSVDFSVISFGAQTPRLDKQTTLTIVLAGSSSRLGRIMEIALWTDRALVAISPDVATILKQVAPEDALAVAADIIEYPTRNVDTDKSARHCEQALARWCATKLPDHRLNLALALPFLRQAAVDSLTRQTALENAVISAVFFLPGSDMPALTMNQAKLLYQIAVINGFALNRQRFIELAVIIASGFGLRALSRLLTKRVGSAAWLLRTAVSCGGTLAIGHLAHFYYAHGGLGLLGNKKDAVDDSLRLPVGTTNLGDHSRTLPVSTTKAANNQRANQRTTTRPSA